MLLNINVYIVSFTLFLSISFKKNLFPPLPMTLSSSFHPSVLLCVWRLLFTICMLQNRGRSCVGRCKQSIQPAQSQSQGAGRWDLPDVHRGREGGGRPGGAAEGPGQQEPQDRGGLHRDPAESLEVRPLPASALVAAASQVSLAAWFNGSGNCWRRLGRPCWPESDLETPEPFFRLDTLCSVTLAFKCAA